MAMLVLQAKHWSAANALLCYNLYFVVHCSDTGFWYFVHTMSLLHSRTDPSRKTHAETSLARHRFHDATKNLLMTADFTFIVILVCSHHKHINVPPFTEKKQSNASLCPCLRNPASE